jgi:mevalonate kinase
LTQKVGKVVRHCSRREAFAKDCGGGCGGCLRAKAKVLKQRLTSEQSRKERSINQKNQDQSKWHFENYDVVEKLFVACWLPI